MRKYATELVALGPDVILASTTAALAPLLEASRTVPIVFASVADPVAAGFVESLARPRGNATGFTVYEYSISGKWLELLKEIAPRIARAAILRDPTIPQGIGQFGAIQAVAPGYLSSAPCKLCENQLMCNDFASSRPYEIVVDRIVSENWSDL